MKTTISVLIVLFSFSIQAQRLDVKLINGVNYKVQQDTSNTGVITITKTPLVELGAELQSQVNDIDSQVLNLDAQIEMIKKQKAELKLQRDQLVALITKLNGFK